MNIREMTIIDIDQLAGLYAQFWDEQSDTDKMKALFGKLEKNDAYKIYCAEEGERLLGSVMGIVCQELYGDCTPFLVVENMIVDKNARRDGVGKVLLIKLEAWAKEQGCRQMLLVTEANRADACAFYEAFGFSKDNKGYKKKI